MREETTMSLKVDDVDKDPLGGDKAPGAREKKAASGKERKAAAAAPDANKTKKKPSGKKENPYASRGLDKFSTVLAELESRREKVLRRVDGDRVLVRFVQSEAKGWVPIVVKLPPEELKQAAAGASKGDSKKKCFKAAVPAASSVPSSPPGSSSPREVVKHAAATTIAPAVDASTAPARKNAAGKRWSWGRKVIRPSEYWPFVSVLLLVSLVVFGRVFAICCTSIWWYLVPILSDSNGCQEAGQGVRKSMGKIGKDLVKKASDKNISEKLPAASLPAPTHGKKISSGVHEVISPRSQGKKG